MVAMGRVTTRRPVLRLDLAADSAARTTRPDTLVVEEPLEIRVGGESVAVTMRTPGDDFDLAAGFLLTEGALRARDELLAIRYCAGSTDEGVNTYNLLDVDIAASAAVPAGAHRRFYTTSSCGVCGKASLDVVRTSAAWSVREDPVRLDPTVIAGLPESLRSAQRVFDRTGGLHAAGLFDATGTLLCLREDVGRHNAFDKVIGWALREGRVPLRGTVMLASGRASFELTQKALMAGVPALAAVSAPSSLAVDLAEEAGMTLVGFLRGSTMNVYAGAHRLRA
jgi:FdhD protein